MNVPVHHWFCDPLAEAPDRRRAWRRPVLIQARKKEGGKPPVEVVVTDLTPEGCRIEGEFEVAEGAEVWLAIPGIAPRRARIAWALGGAAGCAFVFPVLGMVVDDVAGAVPRG